MNELSPNFEICNSQDFAQHHLSHIFIATGPLDQPAGIPFLFPMQQQQLKHKPRSGRAPACEHPSRPSLLYALRTPQECSDLVCDAPSSPSYSSSVKVVEPPILSAVSGPDAPRRRTPHPRPSLRLAAPNPVPGRPCNACLPSFSSPPLATAQGLGFAAAAATRQRAEVGRRESSGRPLQLFLSPSRPGLSAAEAPPLPTSTAPPAPPAYSPLRRHAIFLPFCCRCCVGSGPSPAGTRLEPSIAPSAAGGAPLQPPNSGRCTR